MGKVYTTSEDLTSIANAIRAKTGSNAAITYPAGFVSEIGNISTSSGSQVVEPKDVNFIDYDGTLLYSYTKTEAQALTVLPDNPSHTRLTAQGWNWSLAEIKEQLIAEPNQPIIVGQMYVTASGDTEIDIILDDPNYLSPYLFFKYVGEVSIDWGDNTIDTLTTVSSLSDIFQLHNYANTGNYTIKIKVNNGSIELYNTGSNQVGILRTNNQIESRYIYNCIYNKTIQGIYLGLNVDLGNYAFAECSHVKYITLSNTITKIISSSFYNCVLLNSITIPNTITEINDSTFYQCYNLKWLSLPHTITKISLYNTFGSCKKLQYTTISNLATADNTNEKQTFYNCYNLRYISSLFLSKMTSLPTYMVSNTEIETITIPSSITSIGNYCFNGDRFLKTVTMTNNVSTIGTYAFGSCDTLTTLTLSNTLTVIPTGMCSSCKSLNSIIIPDSVTSINNNAFYGCSGLMTLTIPSNVTNIGGAVTSGCSSLIEYHIKPTIPPTLGNNALGNASSMASIVKIYVPYSSDHSILEAYQTADKWSAYINFMIEEPAPTE